MEDNKKGSIVASWGIKKKKYIYIYIYPFNSLKERSKNTTWPSPVKNNSTANTPAPSNELTAL